MLIKELMTRQKQRIMLFIIPIQQSSNFYHKQTKATFIIRNKSVIFKITLWQRTVCVDRRNIVFAQNFLQILIFCHHKIIDNNYSHACHCYHENITSCTPVFLRCSTSSDIVFSVLTALEWMQTASLSPLLPNILKFLQREW